MTASPPDSVTGRVIVAMSGGVDSAVAALLLLREGLEVHGLYMHNWDDSDGYCTSATDWRDAQATCAELGIPLHRVDFSADYRARVFSDFLAGYRAGLTPNPDVACNREIKFDLCRSYARRLGGRQFATGHYARLAANDDGPALYKASDPAKDQSYFLAAVRRADFAQVRFPLADLDKGQVRQFARQAGLAVNAKPDSTGICFIGERPFADFLAQHLPEAPGPIETSGGQTLGTHRGLAFYTLGQRDGLGLGGQRGLAAGPWFVARKDIARNALVVMQEAELAMHFSHGVRLTGLNWLAPPADTGAEIAVKLRYRQPDQRARIVGQSTSSLELEFTAPQRAVTPGQYGVLYDGERCLGGGVIDQSL